MRFKAERIAGLFSTVVFLLIGSLVGVSYAEDDKEGGGDKETTEWFNHLGSRTMERWPDDFAGLKFVEPGTPLGGVEVRFSEGAEEKVAEIAKEAPQPELLIPVNVPKSQAQIAHEMALVISDREEAKRGLGPLAETKGMFDMDADLGTGEILVMMPDPTEKVRTLINRTYPYKFKFVESALGEFGACGARDDCNDPLRAGVQARNSSTPYDKKKCSTGFTVLYEGTRHLMSAAHCSEDGHRNNNLPNPLERRWNGPTTTAMGKVVQNNLFGAVDVELLEPINSFTTAPFVYKTVSDKMWEVKSRHDWADFAVDMTVCRSGNTTGYSCGDILGVNFTPTKFINSAHSYIRTDACSGSGDSGGPWFRGTIAAGIHAGWIDGDDNPLCDGDPMQSYFGSIDYAIWATGSSMVFSP